jgi:hypothetical protein
MKKVINASTATAKQPFYGRTMSHIMESLTEVVESLVRPLIGSYVANDLIILYGCQLTGSFSGAGNPFAVTAGAVYYNGEIYQVDAVSGTISGANVLVGTITTTYQLGDPVTMSDNSAVNVHEIRKVVITQAGTGSGTKDYSLWKRRQLINDNAFSTAGVVGIGGLNSTGVLLFSFTTPNDGVKRDYHLNITSVIHANSGADPFGYNTEIFKATVSQSTELCQINNGERHVFTHICLLPAVPPNTLIEIKHFRITLTDGTVDRSKMTRIGIPITG